MSSVWFDYIEPFVTTSSQANEVCRYLLHEFVDVCSTCVTIITSIVSSSCTNLCCSRCCLHYSTFHIWIYHSSGIVSWVVAIAIVYHERHRPISIGSHGIPLVVWLLNGVWESFQLLGWSNPHWWWSLHCTTDIANLTLYFIRSVLVSGVISVGVVWPLCTRKAKNYSLLVNSDPVDTTEHNLQHGQRKEGSFVQKRTSSTFPDLWDKVKLLFPYYVWPRGHPLLQLRVAVCFMILELLMYNIMFRCIIRR